MNREELDFIGAMNMCDEISNEAYKKIVCHFEQQEPCDDAIKYFKIIYELSQTLGVSYDFIDEKIKEIIQTLKDKALKQEPCVDAISRQAFEDAIEKAQYSRDFCKEHHIDYSISMEMVRIVLHDLPPVKPAEKVGQWIDGKCNRCGTHAPYWAMASTYYCSDYCPKCGAKMQKVEE